MASHPAIVSATAACIRRMTSTDLDDVAANERHSFDFPWSRTAFADCLDAGHECWVATADDALIGHGVLSVAADEAQLLDVCVVPEARGAGWGRALAVRLIERAEVAGAQRVFLEVRVSNRVAMTLYDALGFREIARRRGYYPTENSREDALVMALDLAVKR